VPINHSPAAILRINEMMLTLKEIYAGACYGRVTFQKGHVLDMVERPAFGGSLLHGSWWKGKPTSQMTSAELEEQDPEFWRMWEDLRGVSK
jgi:hypothetical protein